MSFVVLLNNYRHEQYSTRLKYYTSISRNYQVSAIVLTSDLLLVYCGLLINDSNSRKNFVEKNAKTAVFMYYKLNKQDVS